MGQWLLIIRSEWRLPSVLWVRACVWRRAASLSLFSLHLAIKLLCAASICVNNAQQGFRSAMREDRRRDNRRQANNSLPLYIRNFESFVGTKKIRWPPKRNLDNRITHPLGPIFILFFDIPEGSAKSNLQRDFYISAETQGHDKIVKWKIQEHLGRLGAVLPRIILHNFIE